MSASHNHKTRTLWLMGILHAFTHIYQIVLIPLYLLIQRGLKLESVERATLLVTVMGVAYYLPSYPLGVLADRHSRKMLLAIGLALNGLGFICLGFAPNYACALAGVVLAGFGGSFYHPAATALIARAFPKTTGRALGLAGMGASAGFFVGPIYSGWRAQATGNWRYPVVEIGALGVIFAGIFYWLAEEEATGCADASTSAAKPQEKLFPTKILFAIFLFMAVAFSLRDFAGTAMGSLGSLFLQDAHGFTPQTTGFMLSGLYVASAISNPLFGHLSDGGRVRWALMLLSLATLLVALFPHVPRGWMMPVLAAYGFFFMASYPVVEAALMESVPDSVRGRVFGLFVMFGGLLGNLSHWAVGAFVKNLGPSAALPASYYLAYGVMALLMFSSLAGLPCLHAIRKREGLAHVPAAPAPRAAALPAPNSALE
jgi:FSR family fosmidomycin resistance protein-like MFS transporter